MSITRAPYLVIAIVRNRQRKVQYNNTFYGYMICVTRSVKAFLTRWPGGIPYRNCQLEYLIEYCGENWPCGKETPSTKGHVLLRQCCSHSFKINKIIGHCQNIYISVCLWFRSFDCGRKLMANPIGRHKWVLCVVTMHLDRHIPLAKEGHWNIHLYEVCDIRIVF